MKVLILSGGDSSERKISFLSAKNVQRTLKQSGHSVKIYDLRNGYDPIIQLSEKYDVLFPVLHGEEGEGGKLHKFLAKTNKPIVGTRNYQGMKSAWYKISFKTWCDKNKIRTSAWKAIKNKNDIKKFGFPSVLKTSSGGSSREVVILKSAEDLNSYSILKLLRLKIPMYAEKYLEGIEITVGVFNNKALPVIEIVPPKGKWFSYKNKYDNSTQEIPFAPSVRKELQKEAQKIALRIHNHFNLGSYSRTDFIVSEGKIYVLEINTIPGLTSGSLLPKALKATKISFNDFLETLLRNTQ